MTGSAVAAESSQTGGHQPSGSSRKLWPISNQVSQHVFGDLKFPSPSHSPCPQVMGLMAGCAVRGAVYKAFPLFSNCQTSVCKVNMTLLEEVSSWPKQPLNNPPLCNASPTNLYHRAHSFTDASLISLIILVSHLPQVA